MTSRGDKVEKSMDTIVSKTWVSFNSGFFSENIIILSLQVSSDFSETSFVINLVTKSRCVDHCQCNTSTLLFKVYFVNKKPRPMLHTYCDRLDSNSVFYVCIFRIICFFMFQYRFPT